MERYLRRGWLPAILLLAALVRIAASSETKIDLPQRIGEGPGLCVLVGQGWDRTAVDLVRQQHWTIYVQTPGLQDLSSVRQAAEQAGLLGVRIFADRGDASHIALADNLADVVILRASDLRNTSDDETLRVLRPLGRLLVGDQTVTKPLPETTGAWTHPYHGPDNNPQSEDQLARAPYLTHFLTTPWYGPMPQVTVAAGGRVFKAFGHLAFKTREWPMLGKLIAMNGYNGTILWQRQLTPGFMVHRNCLVATPEMLYLADDRSCKRIDAATGEFLDEILVPDGQNDGAAWKWIAMQNGVLYALVGPPEQLHPVQRGRRTQTGWPWTTVRETYDPYQKTWGYGHTLLAIDPDTQQVLWRHREDDLIDSRAVCMNAERIFLYAERKSLAAISIEDGSVQWRSDEPELLGAIGEHRRAQEARYGYWSTSYAKCNQGAVYFAGPTRDRLVAVSAIDGRMLWTFDDGNVQLVLREDGLYAMGRLTPSKKFDYRSGEVLAELPCFRGNCTRATGTADSILARGYRHSGTLRFDVGSARPYRLPAMRPACQDGVIIAHGLLYWGPWMCDCNHSLVGVISLAPAGEFDFAVPATDELRLQVADSADDSIPELQVDDRDWPTYRGDNQRRALTPVELSGRCRWQWEHQPARSTDPSVPDPADGMPLASTPVVTASGLAFFSGSEGIVYAADVATGEIRWKAYTGGSIHYPPTIADDRLYVGSSDGWAYCFAAADGRLLWRFRAAPADRKIPVYGQLSSTWPVASGVLVQDGVAYLAAGIVSHDGTHVYALDAATGRLKWQNNQSGNLAEEGAVTGVSVQGHLLYHNGRLYLAGGNVVSPAIYDSQTGECLNVLEGEPETTLDDHWQNQRSSRGSELFLVEDHVITTGRMLYSPGPDGPPSRYHADYFLQTAAGSAIIQGTDQMVVRVESSTTPDGKPMIAWRDDRFSRVDALATAANACLVGGMVQDDTDASDSHPVLLCLDLHDGHELWSLSLPAAVIPWGLTIDRDGRTLCSLADGRVLCFASDG